MTKGRWEKFSDLLRFLGAEVQRYFIWSIVTGLLLFAVEFAFAQFLQVFLFKLDIGTKISTGKALDQFLLALSVERTILLVVAVGIFRAILQGVRSILWQKTMDMYLAVQRARIIRWVFSSRSINSAEAILLFTERANRSSSAIGCVQQILLQGVTLAFLVASLFWITVPITAISMGALVLLAFAMKNYNLRVGQLGRELVTEWNQLNQKLILSIKNLLLIQIYGTEREEESQALKTLDRVTGHYLSFAKFTVIKSSAPQVFGIALICWIAYFAKKTAALEGPLLLSYFYLFIRTVQNLSELNANVSNLRLGWPQLEDLFSWWQNKASVVSLSAKAVVPASHTTAFSRGVGWNCAELSFRYSEKDPYVFENLNLKIKAGEMLAILGPSGRGKTTLLNLLIGTYEPNAGIIELLTEERAIPLSLGRAALLNSLGYVGPETFLIEGTIRENLLYGVRDRQIADVEIAEVLKAAECDFVFGLKDGLGHFLSEQGQGLSAGQKQRLALARALLRKPVALILDEATSNLDSTTEKRLVQSLSTLKGKMTIIAVTHREPITAIADNIFYMQ